jgi:hypothetical protein
MAAAAVGLQRKDWPCLIGSGKESPSSCSASRSPCPALERQRQRAWAGRQERRRPAVGSRSQGFGRRWCGSGSRQARPLAAGRPTRVAGAAAVRSRNAIRGPRSTRVDTASGVRDTHRRPSGTCPLATRGHRSTLTASATPSRVISSAPRRPRVGAAGSGLRPLRREAPGSVAADRITQQPRTATPGRCGRDGGRRAVGVRAPGLASPARRRGGTGRAPCAPRRELPRRGRPAPPGGRAP